MRVTRIAFILLIAGTLQAWNAAGHRIVAYIAYRNLIPSVRSRVDVLLQSHPDYGRWIAGVPADRRALFAFVHASTWADEIKGDPRYHDDVRDSAELGHPIYPDLLRHRNWHYIDKPLIGDFDSLRVDTSNTTWRNPPTILTQIRAMESVLANKHNSASAKAWALGWLIHLIGDLHQPLHCVSRYGADPATGKLIDDQGGNRVHLAGQQHNLHAFWDDQLGEDSGFPAIESLGDGLMAGLDLPPAKHTSPEAWMEEGATISIGFVYRGLAHARTDHEPIVIPREYSRVAYAVAARRVTLAGYRLAQVLNRLPLR